MSCLFTTIPGNVCQVALYMYLIQARSMNEHRTVINIAVCEYNVMRLIGWLVGWLDSGAPTLMIRHHSLILSLPGPELNKRGAMIGKFATVHIGMYRHS